MTIPQLLKKAAATMLTESGTIINSCKDYPFFSLATFLSGVSIFYGGLVGLRNRLYRDGYLESAKLPCPVISIGNLTLGGTGKTPMTLYLSRMISRMGYKVAVISRGYKGRHERHGSIVSDGRSVRLNVAQAGDEAFLMAVLSDDLPVIVGGDRISAGWTALRTFQPDVILMDDGFQHLRLKRDLDLILLDAGAPFGNAELFPRGPLREPAASLLRADTVILTRSEKGKPVYYDRLLKTVRPRPVFRTFFKSVVRFSLPARSPCHIRKRSFTENGPVFPAAKRLFAFSGLAHNRNFWKTIIEQGGEIVGALSFQDHHSYTIQDMQRITAAARKHGADALITTDKDYVRVPPDIRLPMEITVMGLQIEFEHTENWQTFIKDRLQQIMHA